MNRTQLYQPRLAEMVAANLRAKIVSGELPDGAMLPKQEDLLAEFRVSKPSIREALRILEAEGLITVRRGNVGGAVVHMPQASNAAQTLGIVLGSQNVTVRDLGTALTLIEPVCASLCAMREDREESVLPALRKVHEEILDVNNDLVAGTKLARRFHELLVSQCGNETLIVMVGALETLWASHQQEWAERVPSSDVFPDVHTLSQKVHARMLKLIEKGDGEGVARVARNHLEESVLFSIAEDSEALIRADSLR
jgi:DNA-binding FadR family transcriptional regulator